MDLVGKLFGDRFRGVIARHGAEAIMPCSYMVQEGFLNGLGCGDPFFNRLGATVVERTFCSSGANARFILLWGCNVKCSRIFTLLQGVLHICRHGGEHDQGHKHKSTGLRINSQIGLPLFTARENARSA